MPTRVSSSRRASVSSPSDKRLADAARQAARERDDALAVGRELRQVDARPVPVAVEVGRGHEPHEVVIPGGRLGQEGEVGAALLLDTDGVVVDHVHLAAEDRLDPDLGGRPRELHRPGHRAVVGEPDGRHPELGRLGHERVDPARPIEDRVLAVDVQMDVRLSLGHGVASLTSGGDGAWPGSAADSRHSRCARGFQSGSALRWREASTAAPATAAAAPPTSGSHQAPARAGGAVASSRGPCGAPCVLATRLATR